jgi:hypothetical protein
VSDIDTWLYADDRAVGDTQVIETDTAVYYVYVTGLEEMWHSDIKTAIAQASYNDWHTSVSENFTITEKSFGKKLVMQ